MYDAISLHHTAVLAWIPQYSFALTTLIVPTLIDREHIEHLAQFLWITCPSISQRSNWYAGLSQTRHELTGDATLKDVAFRVGSLEASVGLLTPFVDWLLNAGLGIFDDAPNFLSRMGLSFTGGGFGFTFGFSIWNEINANSCQFILKFIVHSGSISKEWLPLRVQLQNQITMLWMKLSGWIKLNASLKAFNMVSGGLRGS